MLGMLIAYDVDGNVIGTRDYQVIYDPDTLEPLGFADYLSHEQSGGENSDWGMILTYDHVPDKKGSVTLVLRDPQPVKGSKVWPEFLGGYAHHFKVRLDGPPGQKRIGALIHKDSGVVRERAAIEAAIDKRIKDAKGKPADIRDLVGGPDRPLQLDENGRTKPKVKAQPSKLPVIRAGRG